MRIRTGCGLASAALLIATVTACAEPAGSPDESPGGPPPVDAAVSGPDQLQASCGSVAFDTLPADWSAFTPLAEAEVDLDLERAGEEAEFFDDYEWYVAAHTSDSLTLFGIASDERRADLPAGLYYADASFQPEGDRWVPQGWGQCRVEVDAEGWGNARFVLDPEVSPDPAGTTISVLAWEMNCASGQAPEGRAVEPVVLTADEQAVSVVVLVEPVAGAADCQSNPSFPLEFDLGEPLGDRQVMDASVAPPLTRPWPPSQSSLDSEGLDE